MRILLSMPKHWPLVDFRASRAYWNPTLPGSQHEVFQDEFTDPSSLLPGAFNRAWVLAVNNYEAGKLDGFSMIHSDVETVKGFVDYLEVERQRCGADILAAVIAIKDPRGNSSTAIDTNDPWQPRRLTMSEIHQLPETFTSEAVEKTYGGKLLVNTGLWICKLGSWAADVSFEIVSRNVRCPDGKLRSAVASEDWQFSRLAHKLGLKVAATRKIEAIHHGFFGWSNQAVWGNAVDIPDEVSRV